VGSELVFGGPEAGVYRASVTEFQQRGFDAAVQVSARAVSALAWSSIGIYAGTNNYALGAADRYSIGLIGDNMNSLEPVLSLCDLAPRACPQGSTLSQCGDQPHFLAERRNLPLCQTNGDGGAGGPPAPTTIPSMPGSPDAGVAPASVRPKGASGCDIAGAAASSEQRTAGALLVGFAAAVLIRRRRRPERSHRED
jgi:MYXO-CTERM domain-containing protein